MPVEEIRLGPFVGGLNTFSDATSIGDTEVVVLENFETDIDGSLVNRPPMAPIGVTIPGSDGSGINVLGFYEGDANVKYLIATNRNNSTYFFNGATWTLITATFAATAIAQYRAELWLVAPPGSANPGGKWTPGGGFIADANMPKGGCAVAAKDRVWIGPGATAISNGARLYLSNIVSGLVSWPVTPNYLQIGAGDGQNIVDIGVYFDSLIIFKQGSTYRYSFSSDPALGVISRISDNIGAIAKGCFAGFKNEIYVLFDNKVYLFSNYNYDELNVKVPLVANNPAANLAEQTSISVWSDRVFVQYYDVTYVFNLNTRTWSVWKSTIVDFMGRFWGIPGQQGNTPTAYTYRTARTGYLGLYQCIDAITTVAEPMACKVVTKNYDYQSSNKFKRLVSWGVDLISKVAITSKVSPITYASPTTWNQLRDDPNGPGGKLYTGIETNYAQQPTPTGTAIPWRHTSPGGEVVTRALNTTAGDGPQGRTGFVRSTVTTAKSSGFSGEQYLNSTPNLEVDGQIGDIYSAGSWVRFSQAVNARQTITYRTGAGVTVGTGTIGVTLPIPANTWTFLTLTGPAAIGLFQELLISPTTADPMPIGSTYDMADVIIVKGSTPPTAFFKGGMLDDMGGTISWTGAPNASASQKFGYVTVTDGYTWDNRKNGGYTWDRPLDFSITITDPVVTGGSGTGRKYIKFLKSLRFRQVNFELSATTNGDTATAPIRIFNIMTRVAQKQGVSKKIS